MNFLRKIVNKCSIKQKLIALSMITSTIATIVTCGGFIIFNIMAERGDLLDEIRFVTRIFAEELSKSVLNQEKDQVIKSLDSLKTRESLIQTCIYVHGNVQDGKAKEFVQFIRDQNRGRACADIPKVKGRYEFRKDDIAGEHLIVSAYIVHNDHTIGHIIMLANFDRIHERMNRGIFNSSILFIIILLVSYLISRSLQAKISTPILHLADLSYVVRGGDYTVRAQHYSNDELGVLTEAYNNMLKEIQYAKEHLEEKVVERTQDLEKAMQIKEQFLSNMSHEIRIPIHGIMNYVDFLVQDWEILEQEQRYSFIKKLHINSSRLLSLINNLLDLSKLDAGKMEFFMQKEDLITLVEGVIQECEALLMQNKNIILDFECKREFFYKAILDNERIAQVVRNLLSNAIKFTKKGKITMKLEIVRLKKHKAIQFSISDEGVGIPADELEYIFDKFNQSTKTKTGAGGTGLGLAISKEIIKAHQGVIWAANNSNNIGSTFTFIIPVNQQKNKES